MIKLSKLNKDVFYINPNLIEFIEETPDSVISMTNGKKVLVSEAAEEIIEKIVEYYRRIYTDPPRTIKQQNNTSEEN